MKNNKEKDAECHYDTSPVDMQEGLQYIYDDKNGKQLEKKTEYPDDTSPVEMQEGVNNRNYNRNEKTKRKKRQVKQKIMISPKLVKVKE